MIEEAREKGIYDRLEIGDINQFLRQQQVASADLIVAADVFAYVADLADVCLAVARVLSPDGLFAFTVETHDGEGAIVGAKMRYQHSAAFVRAALADAGLRAVCFEAVSTRNENRAPVPGLLVIASR